MSKAADGVTEVAGTHADASKAVEARQSHSSASKAPKKRVSQACSRCRSRKDKCDGKKPICSGCAEVDEDCVYDAPTKKRGLPEGYVRGLEKLWGISLRKVDGLEASILKVIETGNTDPQSLAKIWNDKECNETLVETWRGSNLYQELDKLLPLLDLSDDKPGKRKRTDAGPVRRIEEASNQPYLIQASIQPEKTPPPGLKIGYPSDIPTKPQEILRRKSSTIPNRVSIRNPPLPDRTWNLIDIYFSYTHCWFPIIEKHELLRLSYQYSSDDSPSTSHKSGNLAVLWAVLAYADHQNRAIRASSADNGENSDRTMGRLYEECKMHIPAEEGDFELGHVQALLLLTLLNMGLGNWSGAWLLVGKAVRIAIDLGLNHATDTKSLNAHVFLGCFVLDTLTALYLDRTPQIRVSDIKHSRAVDEDGLDEWNPWVDCLSLDSHSTESRRGPVATLSTFNSLIRHIIILSSIINNEHPSSSYKLQGLLSELESWSERNPAQFIPNSSNTTRTHLLPHQYHLHLAHFGTTAAVYNYLGSSNTGEHASDNIDYSILAASAHKTMWLLAQHSEAFGLSIAPPTFACFIKVSLGGVNKVPRNVFEGQNITLTEWQDRMANYVSVMSATWPTFDSLKTMTKLNLRSPQDNSRPLPPTQPTVDRHLATSGQLFSQLAPLPIASDDLCSPNHAITNGSSTVFLDRLVSNNLPQNRPPQSSASIDGSSSSWQEPAASWNHSTSQPLDNIIHDVSAVDTFNSHIDGDSTFNEFAAIDAMEWNNNWDQSLINLGFTETEMMGQEFNNFCQIPEPTSNDLVQQLLADAEVSHPLLGIIHGVPDPNVLEASQTLQSMFRHW